MKLHLAQNQGQQLFTGYGAGYVAVNNVRYEKSVLVTPASVSDWPVRKFEDLSAADFRFIAELKAEVVIFGTGRAQRFPLPELARALAASGAGVEIMDSKAACRTYNILAAEGRGVVAAILME
ncbi:MAG TPA: Mth938-like domain-containing protein [Burkholderiales bacterium]|nr:Mth938-like domain-containing protein [Burkholderiales bacterium]